MLKEQLILILGEDPINSCIVCCEDTLYIVKCCHAPICKQCYLKWLQQKRQCLHCQADQCYFNTWVDNYRKDASFYFAESASFSSAANGSTISPLEYFSSYYIRMPYFSRDSATIRYT